MRKTMTLFVIVVGLFHMVWGQTRPEIQQNITEQEKIQLFQQLHGGGAFAMQHEKTAPTHDPDLDMQINVPDFTLPGAGSTSLTFNIGSSNGNVVGFSFEGTVTGISGNLTWASDMKMIITSPSGRSFSVGGFWSFNNNWAFQGGISTSNGTYTSQHFTTDAGNPIFSKIGTPDQGAWTIDFIHDWDNDMHWTDMTITLHKIPTPPIPVRPISAAIALLLMAGLMVYRSRAVLRR